TLSVLFNTPRFNVSFTGNGAGLTNLSAGNLTGTIADARLSANVALSNTNQVFTGSNRFAGVVSLTNAANTLVGAFAGNGAGITNVNLMTVNSMGAIDWTTNSAFVLASSPVVGSDPFSVVAADVNGDGKLDLISANDVANTLSVLTNNGNGGFVL